VSAESRWLHTSNPCTRISHLIRSTMLIFPKRVLRVFKFALLSRGCLISSGCSRVFMALLKQKEEAAWSPFCIFLVRTQLIFCRSNTNKKPLELKRKEGEPTTGKIILGTHFLLLHIHAKRKEASAG